MRSVLLPLCLLLVSAAPARVAPIPIFVCSIGEKQVTVHKVGDELVYRFGTAAKAELTIVGSVARRNLHFRTERYANMLYQLRFQRGAYSYIVFSLGGNPSVEAMPVSGLTILRGTTPVAERTCRRWSELRTERIDTSRLPRDSDAYSGI